MPPGRPSVSARAQAGARRQVAALDHHQRVAGRGGDEVLERRRRLLAGRPHADHPPTAHQRHRREFIGQPRRIVLQHVARDVDDAERVLEVLAHRLGQGDRALGDQAVVVAVDDHAANLGIRLLEKPFDLARLDLHADLIG
jgi:hypothetical protein